MTTPQPHTEAPIFGVVRDRVAAQLDARKMKPATLATGSNTDRGNLSRFLNGKGHTPTLPVIDAWARTLGVTIAELIGEHTSPDGLGRRVPVAWVKPSPLNPRKTFEPEPMAEIEASIVENGILQPVLTRRDFDVPFGQPGCLWLIIGERRYRGQAAALDRLGDEAPAHVATIPVVISAIDNDADHLKLAIVENLQREDVPPLEEAAGFDALAKAGWSNERIAQSIGKSKRYVEKRRVLTAKLSKPAVNALSDGEITVSQAVALTAGNKEQQREALQAIRNGWGGYRTGPEIRRTLLHDRPPVDVAAFPLERYTGTIIAGEDGEPDRFEDRAQVERLQLAAAKAKVAELRDHREFVELVDLREGGYLDLLGRGFEHARASAKRVGALVVIERDLEVEVIDRLVMRKDQAKAKAKPAGEKAPPKVYTKAQLSRAHRHKTVALQTALAQDPTNAMRAIIVAIMGRGPTEVRRDHPQRDDRVVATDVAIEACRLAKGLTTDRDGDDMPSLHGYYNAKDPQRIADAIMALDDADVPRLFAHLVAAATGSWGGFAPEIGDAPIALALAKATGADPASTFRLDADYLDGAGKRELLEIAAEALATGKLGLDDFAGDTAVAKRTAKVLRQDLSQAAEAGKLDGYVPRAVRFGTTADLEQPFDVDAILHGDAS